MGTYISTTEGANYACGVSGIPNSWPLCSGTLGLIIQDVIIQSQAIHRWLVLLVLCMLIWLWKDQDNWVQDEPIRKLSNYGTVTFIGNIILGAAYVLSWTSESGFMEWLSVVHLLVASLTFLFFASGLILIRIHGKENLQEE